MKKNKKIIIIIAVVLLILALGITAVCLFGNNDNKLKTNKDILIGVFLTTDSVFESDYYAGLKTEDNKYYATLTQKNVGEETEENSAYVFEGLIGYGFYDGFLELDIDTHSRFRSHDNAFCNPEISGDFANSVMNATVYVYGKEVSYPASRMMLCLMCAKGREQFYEKHGFIARPTDNLGPGMIQYLE